MTAIAAVYENGLFRPTEAVDLPEGARVRVLPESVPINEPPPVGSAEGRKRIFELLGRRYQSGIHDTAERHNDHQP
jgi:predicted DNA-binding antitoxin AbrB/MazE fold protein